MPQVELTTHRLRLEPLSDAHFEHEVVLDSDPETMRFITGQARSRDAVREFHEKRLRQASIIDGLGMWAGFLRETNEFVGLFMLTPPKDSVDHPTDVQGELGYRLMPNYRRQGLATEGSRELLRHVFQDVGLSRVWATAMFVNFASRATMTAVGLRYVRTYFEDFDDPIDGVDQGEVEYAVTREDWLANEADPVDA